MPELQKRSGLGGWLFFVIVLIGYGLSFLLTPELTTDALIFFRRIMQQVLPVLGGVFILLFIANLLLEPAAVKLPLLPLMIYYFGLSYTLVLCLYLIVFSIINGLLIDRLIPHKA